MFYSHSWKKNQAVEYLAHHTENVGKCCDEAKTKINATKTEAIIFSRKKDKAPKNIELCDKNIKFKNRVKYLEVQLDTKLFFNKVVNITNKIIGALLRKVNCQSRSR